MKWNALRVGCLVVAIIPLASAAEIPSSELTLHRWSGELNVPDPVACAVDPQGRVYVAATTRRKVGDLDIREHPMWIANDVGFTSIEDKQAFLRRELAPGKMRAPRGGLMDHNGDGSIDWRDLTHHSERIYQLRDTDGDGTADKMTVFAEGFNSDITGIAAGVLYHDGWVYATIAPDLWRLKDMDDDGVADVREVVVRGFGLHIAYAGHDMHGPIVGPDGRIYWSIGDKGVNVTSKEGRHFSYPNEGAVMRIEPDGSNFEVYAHGLRNVQEPAFNEYGDLIGVDNDADQPGERERFVHIIEGSDSGWRCNFQYLQLESPWMREGLWRPAFPGQAAYLLPPLASYSDGPGGFKREPGTALGEAQRGVYLLNEFPSGKMRAFRVARDGATYKMTDERVINDGIMGVGMSWHPDGSLMMVDWIGSYALDERGALWRVDAKVETQDPRRAETHQILRAGFGGRPDDELASQLGHPDERVRLGAQLELAKRNRGARLMAVAVDSSATLLARIHAIWGYGQLLRRSSASAASSKVLLNDPESELRAQTAKILGDAANAGAKSEGRALIPLLNDSAARVRSQAAIALGKFREPTTVEPLFALAAREGENPAMRSAIVAGLQGCTTARQLAAKKADTSVGVRLAAVVALRRMRAPELAEFLADSDQRVIEDAARGIHDDLGIPAALPALAEMLERPDRSEPVTRRAINAALRVGTPETAAMLVAYAVDASRSVAMREAALVTLRAWAQPPRLDPVDGYARDFRPAPIAAILTPQLPALLRLETELKTLAIEIMLAHRLVAAPEQLAEIVTLPGNPDALSAQALRLFAASAREHPLFSQTLDAALAAGTSPMLRQAAMELLLPRDPGRLAREARKVLDQTTGPAAQHALGLLAQAAHEECDAVLLETADRLVHGTLAPGLKLDAVEALRARSTANPALASRMNAYLETPAAKSGEILLDGGDVARGRDLATNHLNANCTACHSFDSGGSQVGPNLRSIGRQRDAAYLLESLLNPSAAIATGYGIVNLTLRDRTDVTGTLAKETADAVTVRLFDGKQRTIPRGEVAQQTPPVSIMPPMGAILEPRELRDIVAYLVSLGRPRRTDAAAPRD